MMAVPYQVDIAVDHLQRVQVSETRGYHQELDVEVHQ
jgi:hypothetical protein